MRIIQRLGFLILLSFTLLVPSSSGFAAAEKPNVEVVILSPDQVKDYAGIQKDVKVQVTNHSDMAIDDMMAYITMADLKKHWTVNLEDYSADKPVTIGTIAPHETKEIELPVRFVYTSSYHLYVTATSTKEPWIYSSKAIPIEIMGNTKIDPALVQAVAIGEPVLFIAAIAIFTVLGTRKKRRLTTFN